MDIIFFPVFAALMLALFVAPYVLLAISSRTRRYRRAGFLVLPLAWAALTIVFKLDEPQGPVSQTVGSVRNMSGVVVDGEVRESFTVRLPDGETVETTPCFLPNGNEGVVQLSQYRGRLTGRTTYQITGARCGR